MSKKILLSEQYLLTIQEASIYFRIGEKKLRRLMEEDNSGNFTIQNGNRRLIKRKKFEKFIDEIDQI